MQGVNDKILNARPKLSEVAPLTAAICWGYGLINIGLGLGMFFIYQGTIAPIAVANILSYQQWGAVYFMVGVITVYSLLANRWEVTKNAQIAGLIIKAVWAIALIVRCFLSPQTILITLVWLFFAYIQAVTYVYFLASVKDEVPEDGV